MTTARLSAAERRLGKFTDATIAGMIGRQQEPAMGTLDERLGILVRRLGGHTGAIRASKAERDYFAELDHRASPDEFAQAS